MNALIETLKSQPKRKRIFFNKDRTAWQFHLSVDCSQEVSREELLKDEPEEEVAASTEGNGKKKKK